MRDEQPVLRGARRGLEVSREVYGRGEWLAPSSGEIRMWECIVRGVFPELTAGWYLPEKLEAFARNRLGDAIRAVLKVK